MNQPREQGQRNEEQSKMELISGFEPRAIEISEDKLSLKFENVLNKKKKLVIIQAPINFNIKSLTGQDFILDGHQDLPTNENNDKDKRYEMKSNMNCRKNMKSFNVLIPSEMDAKLHLARPIRGSMKISQAIRIPPVILPEKEEVILPEVPARLIRTWTPFGSEKPKKFGKRKSPEKRRNDHSNKEGTSGILNISNSQPSTAENSFEILSSKRNSKSPKSDLDIDPKLGYFEDKLGSKRKISEKDRDDLSLRRSKKKKHR